MLTDGACTVAVLGQGYVGLPLAMRAAEVGHRVIGFDTDARRIANLRAGESHVQEVDPARLRSLLGDRFFPTTDERDLREFDVALVTVPTPLSEGSPDLSHIVAAGMLLAGYLRPGVLVVLESTTYPGTTEELLASILRAGSTLRPGIDFHLGYSPERIDPGNARFNLVNTPKVVSGVNAASLATVQAFYARLVDRTVAVSWPREAELSKLIENTFRHVNVALVNEIAMFAADLGVDVWEAIDAAASKPFGFMRFDPGPGVGGHCLPIDPSYLSWHVQRSLGRRFRFIELANDINDHMPDYVTQRLIIGLNRRRTALNGSRILLLGLAYKANTSDLRESPALAVAGRLADLGAEVHYHDTHVSKSSTALTGLRAKAVDDPIAELSHFDAVLIITNHDDVDYDKIAQGASYVLDTRHCCSGSVVEHL